MGRKKSESFLKCKMRIGGEGYKAVAFEIHGKLKCKLVSGAVKL